MRQRLFLNRLTLISLYDEKHYLKIDFTIIGAVIRGVDSSALSVEIMPGPSLFLDFTTEVERIEWPII